MQCFKQSFCPCCTARRGDAYSLRCSFFQAVRSNAVKYTPSKGLSVEELDSAVKQIISEGVAASDKPIDIFNAAGLKKPDLSILGD
nr:MULTISPECIES: type I restriction enzyme endonuclease domain-containing protein [Caldanaerobacter]